MASNYDGYLTIGTEIDTTGLKKGIQEVNRKINELEKKKIVTKELEGGAKINYYEDNAQLTEQEQRYLEKLQATKEKLELQQAEINMEMQKTTYETNKQVEAEGKKAQAISGNIAKKNEEISREMILEQNLQSLLTAYHSIQGIEVFTNEDIETAKELEEKINAIANELEEITGKEYHIKGFEEVKQSTPEIKQNLSGVGSSMENIIRKAVKWGLALFSIRSAYNFIRGSISQLTSSNEQLASDVEYIRWALAMTLKPIIETIIKLAYTLLQYINYIAQAWFGVNLFANASAEAFKKTKDNVKGTNKEAKKLQKTLAGFDEMNILQNDTSKGGGGGVSLPSTDLSSMLGEADIPDWVKWIANNGETIKNIIIGIVEAIALFKFAELAYNLAKTATGFKLFKDGILSIEGALVGAGIMIALLGIVEAIQDFESFLEHPSWEGFIEIIGDIGIALGGLGLILIGLGASSGPLVLVIGLIMALAKYLGGLLGITEDVNEEEKEHAKKLGDTKKATEELIDAQNELHKSYSDYTRKAENVKKAEEELKKAQEETGINADKLYKLYSIGEKTIDNMTEAEKEVFMAYMDHKNAVRELNDAYAPLREDQDDLIHSTGELSGAVYQNTKEFDENFKTMIEGYKEGKVSAGDMSFYLNAMMEQMDSKTKKTFKENMPEYIKLAMKEGNLAIDKFFDNTTGGLITVNKTLDTTKSKFQGIANVISKISGINIKFATGGVAQAKGGIVTRLATGGIVNRPASGVPLASAIVGEAGREGIIPLTDSQAMETLGQAIGRYISLNATIPVYVGNRQIAKELKRIETDDGFAYNR